jgi:hypothetical protein
VSGPVFIFCAPELISGGTEGHGSRFHILCSGTPFRRSQGRRVSFSCFALLDFFSTVRRASVLIFMFYTPKLVFGVTEGVGSRFHILRSRTHFRRYQGRQVPFSFFAYPDSFSAVPRALGPVFIFCAPGLVLGGTEGVRSRFLILRVPTRFRRYRGRQVPFSYFSSPDSFPVVPRAPVPVFMFCEHD